MKLTFETWPIERCIEYARNPRKNDHAVDKVAAAIREFGFRVPICAKSDGTVVDGHLRLKAAKKLGLTEVPVVLADDMSEAQIKAFRLSVNKVAELAEWDKELLALEFGELDEMGFDLSLTGFEADEIGALFPDEAKEGLTDDDAVPEAPEQPVTVEGDVWLLGRHRLMCGDSTSIDAVERLMDGRKADMVFTSPPYNADAKAGQGDIFNKKKSVKLYSDGYSDNLASDDYVKFAASVLEMCFAFTDGFIFWNVSYNAKSRFEYIQQIEDRLPYLVEQICWKKSSTIPFKGSLMRDWEPIYVFSTNKQPVAVKQVTSNFWQVSNTGSQAENHKACFPVELPERGIAIVAKNTGIVFEPFGGSGTTAIACEKTGRDCRMMELDPRYCDVIVKRWQDWTGQQATLEATGQTFAELSAEREAA
jgi:DNA modification methylase